MIFESWLRKQKKRDDPIGDLAIDFINSRYNGRLTLDYLESMQACDGAILAFKDAMNEFIQEKTGLRLMGKTKWTKVTLGKIPKIKEKIPVQIFVQDDDGGMCIFTAHHEQGLWFLFDPFENKWRPYHRQQYVTHYRPWPPLPPMKKRLRKVTESKPKNEREL